MYNHSKLSIGLREIIIAILGNECTRSQLNQLIKVSHTLANAFIASKTTAGTLSMVTELTTSDLAYDCIADLFQQDSQGNYTQLKAYFAGLSLASQCDEEMLAHVRRLVFSKVNQGIYRLCSETDPALAKILRNIKIAINTLKNFTEFERFGELCIAPCACNMLEDLPPFERVELQRYFTGEVSGRENIPDMLAKFSLFLREQKENSRVIPLVITGILFRDIYSQKEVAYEEASFDDTLIKKDAAELIKKACRCIEEKHSQKYVGKGKVTSEVFRSYFCVIEEVLIEKFIGMDGEDTSLCEALKSHIPDLTEQEYKTQHRNRIEYLLKHASKEALKIMKKNITVN
jgi:hypothetical protein